MDRRGLLNATASMTHTVGRRRASAAAAVDHGRGGDPVAARCPHRRWTSTGFVAHCDHHAATNRAPPRAAKSAYAVGIAAGADLVASKVDSSYVQSRTAAGGWSQQALRTSARPTRRKPPPATRPTRWCVFLLPGKPGRWRPVVAGGRSPPRGRGDPRRTGGWSRSGAPRRPTVPGRARATARGVLRDARGGPLGPYASGSSIPSRTRRVRGPRRRYFRLSALRPPHANRACRDVASCKPKSLAQNRRRQPRREAWPRSQNQSESDGNHGRHDPKAGDSPGILSACSSAKD